MEVVSSAAQLDPDSGQVPDQSSDQNSGLRPGLDPKLVYWEAGAGLTYFQVPHYRGSDQTKNYLLPYPHIVIESELVSVNRSSINGHVAESDYFKLDLSFAGQLKVDSEDNRAREGMPDLEYVLETGPSAEFLLFGSFSGDYKVAFEIPLRATIATDFKHVETIGWRLVPTMHWVQKWPGVKSWELDSQFRFEFGTKAYHDYFYTVENEFARADRLAYQAEQGYGGVEVKLRLKTAYRRMIVGVFVIYSDVSDAVFIDSPLVVEDSNYSVGLFASWVIGGSNY